MEVSQILDFQILSFLSSVPTWAWIMAIVVFALFMLGDRVLWDFEVKFPLKTGIGSGEIDFECFKKKGPKIGIELSLELECQNKDIEVLLKGISVYQIPASENTQANLFIKEFIRMPKPSKGDEVKVLIDGEEVFSGALVLD